MGSHEPELPELPELPGATPADLEFTRLEREVVHHLFRLQPGYAVGLGIHAYDGLLPDLSAPVVDRWVRLAQELLGRLQGIGAGSLSRPRQVDRALLQLRLQSELFDLVEYPYLERLPLPHISPLELVPYTARPYAPASLRAMAMIRILEGAREHLRVATARLAGPLPAAFVEVGLAMAEGLVPHFEETETFVREQARDHLSAYVRAREEASAAVEGFLAHLRRAQAKAIPDFALGPVLFQRLLAVREGVDLPFEQLLQEGWANLRANQARLEAIARAQRPPVPVPEMLLAMAKDHPTAEGLLPEAAGFVEETRAFLASHDLLSVPTPEHCRVEPTPPVDRAWTTASLDPPGPFEATAYEGVYHVTPVEPGWESAKKEEWLASFNRPLLKNVTVHEVYPGHYVQFLHFRATTRTLTRRVYLSGAFTEGWAHYTEQLVIEQGFGAENPLSEVAELLDALLRNVRLVASIGMHAQDMPIAQATELFVQEAHLERFPAEREAMRGTFNPEYFGYTLGKLSILRARERFLREREGSSLRSFHDRLLSFGAPPVGFLEPLLLEGPLPSA